jgi:hypothetical protein
VLPLLDIDYILLHILRQFPASAVQNNPVGDSIHGREKDLGHLFVVAA